MSVGRGTSPRIFLWFVKAPAFVTRRPHQPTSTSTLIHGHMWPGFLMPFTIALFQRIYVGPSTTPLPETYPRLLILSYLLHSCGEQERPRAYRNYRTQEGRGGEGRRAGRAGARGESLRESDSILNFCVRFNYFPFSRDC